MRYRLALAPPAERQLESLRRQPIFRRMVRAIDRLRDDPRPAGCVKLAASQGWRIRVGDYRVIYEIDDVVRIVSVTKVGNRRDVYEDE